MTSDRPKPKRRPQRLRARKPLPLTEQQILAWADAFHERTSDWPSKTSGAIPETAGDSWNAIHIALMRGVVVFLQQRGEFEQPEEEKEILFLILILILILLLCPWRFL